MRQLCLIIQFNNDEQVNMLFTPERKYHNEEIEAAQEPELEKWIKYEAFEEVIDEGQECKTTRWVVTEK